MMATGDQLIKMVDKAEAQGQQTVSEAIVRTVLGEGLDENTLEKAINQANTVLDDKILLVQKMVKHG